MGKQKLRVEAIILDLDGTVVDSKRAYSYAAKTAFSVFGKHPFGVRTVIEIPRRFEQGIPMDDLMPGIDVTRFREIYLNAYYEATASKTKPFPYIANTLRMLAEKWKLGLTTRRNIPEKEIVEQLEKFSLAKYFQVIVTAFDTVSPKPSPEALIKCSKVLNVSTHDCAVVGDSVVDIRAGKLAGAKTVGVLSGIFSLAELKNEDPDLILESVRKLQDFLE